MHIQKFYIFVQLLGCTLFDVDFLYMLFYNIETKRLQML